MPPFPQRGASLIELMVGILIGLIATVAILRTFAVAEVLKRNATGVAEAQQTGLLAQFTLASEIANAGSGVAAAAPELGTCPDTGDIRTSLRPIPVLITSGADANTPDSVVVVHGAGNGHAAAVRFAADAPAGSGYRVQSPFGLAANDLVVAISLTGSCALTTVANVSPPDGDGVVDIVHSGAADAFPATSRLLTLGPRGRAVRARYDVSDTTLRSLDLLTPGAIPNPLASDVINFKAQYGVDTDGDGFLDAWMSAANPPWKPPNVLAAPVADLQRIKAIRIGFIMRSETFDRGLTMRRNWVLFDCAATDKTQCQGRLTGSLPSGWRYRVYETVIPLRNSIWNASP
jgi:type IV pilus assembly protein PilW